MSIDVADEVAACLESAPSEDCSTGQIEKWLFASQNCVAIRVSRILQDKTARALLTEAAARTWQCVTDPEGKAQRLWRRLNGELLPLAKSSAEALRSRIDHAPEGKVRHLWAWLKRVLVRLAKSSAKALRSRADHAPKGVFAALFAPKYTYHDVALTLRNWTREPLAIKADLIFPYHGVLFGLLPCDKTVWNWVKLPHATNNAVRFPSTGDPAGALPVPPIGDFVAAMVMNRLGMVESLTGGAPLYCRRRRSHHGPRQLAT